VEAKDARGKENRKVINSDLNMAACPRGDDLGDTERRKTGKEKLDVLKRTSESHQLSVTSLDLLHTNWDVSALKKKKERIYKEVRT